MLAQVPSTCSTSNPASCWCTWKGCGRKAMCIWLELWDGLGSWLYAVADFAAAAIWIVNQQTTQQCIQSEAIHKGKCVVVQLGVFDFAQSLGKLLWPQVSTFKVPHAELLTSWFLYDSWPVPKESYWSVARLWLLKERNLLWICNWLHPNVCFCFDN